MSHEHFRHEKVYSPYVDHPTAIFRYLGYWQPLPATDATENGSQDMTWWPGSVQISGFWLILQHVQGRIAHMWYL